MLATIKKLLGADEKENEDIRPQKKELEKMQFKLQALAQTLKGGILNRKKSLHGAEREFELFVKKTKELQEELAACENKCQCCPNQVELNKARNIIITLIASLRDVKADLQFHELLVKREHNKIKDGEIELKDAHEKLRSISRDLDVLHLKGGCMK